MSHMMNEEMKQCIDNCLDCYKICLQMAQHCLKEGGDHAQPEHILLLEECAAICEASAEMMLRGPKSHSAVCGVCAKVCEECATDCERFEDEHMKRCAEICRRCAESCWKMAQMKTM